MSELHDFGQKKNMEMYFKKVNERAGKMYQELQKHLDSNVKAFEEDKKSGKLPKDAEFSDFAATISYLLNKIAMNQLSVEGLFQSQQAIKRRLPQQTVPLNPKNVPFKR